MTAAKHAPRPWTVKPCPCGDCGNSVVVPILPNSESSLSTEDANLVAAAPDLLAACEQWLSGRDARNRHGCEPPCIECTNRFEPIARDMLDAISKARGGK